MTEVGMALYLDLLEEAVNALKEGREPALEKPLAADTEVELRLPAFLPESYIGDVHVRLALYKRIAASESAEDIDELMAEMVDRFSMPPPQGQNLLRIARLKLAARALGIRRLDLGPQGGYVVFEEKNSIDPAAVIRMLQKSPREYRLDGPLKLRISRPMEKEDVRFDFATDLLKRLELATPTNGASAKDATAPGASAKGAASGAKAPGSPPSQASRVPPSGASSSAAAKPAKSGASGGGKRG